MQPRRPTRPPITPHPHTYRRGVQLESLLHGGGQERSARAGTESVLLIAGLGAAAAVVTAELPALSAHMASARDALQARLAAAFGAAACVHGPARAGARLPNTLSISVRGLDAAALLAGLRERLAASAAAACHSGGACGGPPRLSAVLEAIGVRSEYAGATLRLSTGRHTTLHEVGAAAALIIDAAVLQGVTLASGAGAP